VDVFISPNAIRVFKNPDEFLGSGFLKKRGILVSSVLDTVRSVFDLVSVSGFKAVRTYTREFDSFELTEENLRVSQNQIDSSDEKLTRQQKKAIDTAFDSIFSFQSKIAKESMKPIKAEGLEFRPRAIQRLGIYVPGGIAPLPSSLLMAGATAKAAGVKDIFIYTPPRKEGVNDAILYIAKKLGINKIYLVGGAQAIASMALGLPGIMKKADMICGPGNRYVTAAKALAFSKGLVKVDLVAGPSEILIIAEKGSNSKFIAADMLAQAEHGTDSMALLVTTSNTLAEKVSEELEIQLNLFKRNSEISKTIEDWGAIILVEDVKVAVKVADEIAPEHLEIFSENAEELANLIENAGAIFLNTGESFADYGMTGGNHILPTGGTARFLSGLSACEFIVRTYVESMSQDEQKEKSLLAAAFADMEGLEAHSNAARIRGEVE